MQKNKQGPNKNEPYPLAACTTNNIITALEQDIEKDKGIFKFETPNDELVVGFYSNSATFDGMGRNIDAFSFLSISPTQKLRVHPFNIFQGSDSKENCFTTLSDQLIHLQNLTGMTVVVDGIERKLSVEVTADFKALNMMVGRQLLDILK